MHRFLLTPRWWGINLFVVLGVPFCLFMGTWQLGRFEDRVATHEEATSARPADRAAAPLDSLLPVDKNTSGRIASVSGEYADQLLVPERRLDGKSGFYVLTLLRTDTGKAVPVVRGWLPGTADAGRAPAAPTGRVEVTGALQASESSSSKGVYSSGGLPAGQLGVIGAASLVNIVPYGLYDAWLTVQTPADGMLPVAGAGSGQHRARPQGLPEPRLHRRVVRLRRVRAVHVVPALPARGGDPARRGGRAAGGAGARSGGAAAARGDGYVSRSPRGPLRLRRLRQRDDARPVDRPAARVGDHRLRGRCPGSAVLGVCDTSTPTGSGAGAGAGWGSGSFAIAAPPSTAAADEPPCGGLAPDEPPLGASLAPVQPFPEGTHAKRTSYAAFGASSISGASAEGSGSSPVAGSPVAWPTTATPEPVPPGPVPAASAVTVSGPRTVQPRAETLVTLKLP